MDGGCCVSTLAFAPDLEDDHQPMVIGIVRERNVLIWGYGSWMVAWR